VPLNSRIPPRRRTRRAIDTAGTPAPSQRLGFVRQPAGPSPARPPVSPLRSGVAGCPLSCQRGRVHDQGRARDLLPRLGELVSEGLALIEAFGNDVARSARASECEHPRQSRKWWRRRPSSGERGTSPGRRTPRRHPYPATPPGRRRMTTRAPHGFPTPQGTVELLAWESLWESNGVYRWDQRGSGRQPWCICAGRGPSRRCRASS